jgi:hypothetical protein
VTAMRKASLIREDRPAIAPEEYGAAELVLPRPVVEPRSKYIVVHAQVTQE